MTAYLQAWCLANGAPPEVVARVVLSTAAPLPGATEALGRAVVGCLAESIESPGTPGAVWAEAAAVAVLAILTVNPNVR